MTSPGAKLMIIKALKIRTRGECEETVAGPTWAGMAPDGKAFLRFEKTDSVIVALESDRPANVAFPSCQNTTN
jgi:hypothetical protein